MWVRLVMLMLMLVLVLMWMWRRWLLLLSWIHDVGFQP